MVSVALPPMLKYLVVSWCPGAGPRYGAAVTEEEPLTIPAFPDAEKSAPSAALWKLPRPAPLFDDEPAVRLSNVSVLRPSELSFTPAASTCGEAGAATTMICAGGLA